MSTFEQVRAIILELGKKNITPEMITPEARFVEDLGFDSLNMTETLVLGEAAFSTSFDLKDLQKLFTVAMAVDYIDKKLGK